MKKFLINIIGFALISVMPLLILLIPYLSLDPFKVIKAYGTFYNPNVKGSAGLNRAYIRTIIFLKNCKKTNTTYNSFIFGNSRSMFYQVSDWKKHLSPESNCYHFNAPGEALWALNKKIEFLDNQGLEIKNALLILDYAILTQDNPKSGHLDITTPVLGNNSNIIDFHLTLLRAFLSPKFLYAFIDFRTSGAAKPYMKKNNIFCDAPINYASDTNEVRWDYSEDLIRKNLYYTPERLSVFNDRDTIQSYSSVSIEENQKVIFSNIHRIFKKHNTKVKIAISPSYDQIKLNKADLSYLKYLFGRENVYDFSGINEFTNDYRNYYDQWHYRPHVSREIIEEIYKNE